MDGLKELRKIKQSYTKEYSEEPTLVLNLKNYPEVDLIVTHGDGKSWGHFIRLNEEGRTYKFNLGRANQITYFIFKSLSFSYSGIKQVVVLYNNPMVVNLYTNVFQQLISSMYGYVCSWDVHREIYALLSINPVLFLNLNDSFFKDYIESRYASSLKGHYRCFYWKELSAIPFISKRGYYSDEMEPNSYRTYDFRKPLIKDAFNMHPKYIRAAIKCNFGIERIYALKESGYSADEIVLYQRAFGNYRVPLRYLSNKKVVKFFCSLAKEASALLNYYIDYLRTLDNLPNESKSEFPLTPMKEKIKKWHDRAVDFSIRHRCEIENLRNKELDEKYKNVSYQLAKSFEFSDDKFSIIACKQLSELFTEGQVLKHCVGSYVKSVSEGNEYILFLRKNDLLDTPFFTIDVTPDKKVRQIHGFCNCNITDEIRPFVKKWAEKFKLNISDCSGVFCALR